jgi:hypothetical protein
MAIRTITIDLGGARNHLQANRPLGFRFEISV